MTSRPLSLSLILLLAYAQGCIFSEDFGSSGGSDSDDGLVIVLDMAGDEGLDAPDTLTPPEPCAEGCHMGETCVDGECQCGSGEACSNGAICVLNECRAVECVVGGDAPAGVPVGSCMPGQVCENFVCVPVECQVGDSTCDEGFVCDADSNTCKPGCESDDECPGANSACVEGKGVCVDLLSDPKNCGVVGVTCNESIDAECIDGLCTCGMSSPSETSSFSKPIFDSNTRGFTIWPPAELTAYPARERYVCPRSDVPIEECPDARFDDDYGLKEPHFIAIGALRQSGAPSTSRIEVRTLDGRGRQIGSEEIYVGDAALGERKLLKFKLVPVSLEETRIFALWEGDNSTRTVVSYMIKASDTSENRMSLERNEQVWAQARHITDFSVALWQDNRDENEPLTIVAIPITMARDGDLANGVFGVRGFAFAKDKQPYLITSQDYEVADMGQVLRDFGTTMTENGAGEPELHAVILDGTYYDGGVHPKGDDAPAFFSKAFYNRYAFKFSEPKDVGGRSVIEAERMPELRTTVGSTILNVGEIIGVFLSGDESVLPAPFFAFWQGMSFVTLGWSRAKGTNDVSTYVYRALGPKNAKIEFGNPLIGSTVYDSRLTFENADESYLYRIDVRIDGNATEDISQVKASRLIDGDPLQLSEARAISPPITARRLRAVAGPHATGLLVTSRDQGSQGKAELYFVAGGNRAVCKPMATP